MKQFKQYKISKNILKALTKLDYKHPTKVQEVVIDKLLNNENIIVASQTGSGKTASFGIPIINQIDWLENSPQALILTPTRELAIQVKQEIENIGVYERICVNAIYGKTPITKQMLELKQKNHIVVATPGRLLDLIDRRAIDLSKVKTFVIDEVDEMFKMGFIEQVEEIYGLLNKDINIALFSATVDDTVVRLANSLEMNVEPIVMEKQVSTITYEKVITKEKYKPDVLLALLSNQEISSAIIFANTQEKVDDICYDLEDLDVLAGTLHGGMMQKERIENLEKFKEGKLRVLVATDVAARGLDIEDVSIVIHYELASSIQTYLHRSGRSGRKGKQGLTILMLNNSQNEYLESKLVDYPELVFENLDILDIQEQEINLEHLRVKGENKNIKKLFKDEHLTTLYISAGKTKKMRNKDIVGAMLEVEGVSFEDIGKINVKENVSYVDILNDKEGQIIKHFKHNSIKGKKVKVEKAK